VILPEGLPIVSFCNAVTAREPTSNGSDQTQ
jgi:hypothetical protein